MPLLVFYIFNRRVTLSEWQSAALGIGISFGHASKSSRGGRGSSPVPSESDEKRVKRLRELLDLFAGFLFELPFTRFVLDALTAAVSQAGDKPGVRKQTLEHSLKWLLANDFESLDDIPAVHDLVVIGCTDVWSAIRKNCAAMLSDLVRQWHLTRVEPLFERFVEICNSTTATWKSKEGALLAITNIIRKFRWATASPVPPASAVDVDGNNVGAAAAAAAGGSGGGGGGSKLPAQAADTAFRLKFGPDFIAPGLPDFVTSGFRTMVYEMLAHKQLSIRDSAAKAFSAYLARSQYQEVLLLFHEIVERLRRKTPCAETTAAAPTQATSTLTAYGFYLLDDYEAEGLLGVCLFIIKHLQPGFLLPNW